MHMYVLLACASCLLISVIDLPSPAKPSPRVLITNPASSLTGLRSTYSSILEVLRFKQECNRHAARRFLHRRVWPAGQGGCCSKSRCRRHSMLWLWSRQRMAGLHVYMSGAVAAGCSSCLQLQQRAALGISCQRVTVSIHRVNPYASAVLQHREGGQVLCSVARRPQSGGLLGALTALPARKEAVLLQTA